MTGWGPNIVLGWFRKLQIASIALPIFGCLIWGAISFSDQNQAAGDHARDNVALVRQYLQRIVETEQLKHRAATSRAAGEPVEFLRSESFHRFLASIDDRQQKAYGVAIMTVDGEMIASSVTYPINQRVPQRDYLDAVRDGNPLYIDRIRLQPNGEDALIVATPFVTPGFRGVIVSSMPADESRSFLRDTAVRKDEAASLMRDDGKLLIRREIEDPSWIPETSPSRRSLAMSDQGLFTTVAVTDKIERIYAYSRLGSLPLVANFGVPTALVWQETLKRALPVWLLMVAIGAFSFIIGGFARRSILTQLISERRKLQLAEAERLAEQREQLMREMNHRVKNNLSMINSLISIQARKGSLNARDLQMRVQALAEVHDLLYQSDDNERIDLGDLLRRACNPALLIPEDREIRFEADLPDGILLSADRASPLSLASLELVTNAIKHAFTDRHVGLIRLTLALETEPNGDETGVLTVSDDGVGFAEATTRRSGTAMVDAFARQVGGEIHRDTSVGTTYTIRFPL